MEFNKDLFLGSLLRYAIFERICKSLTLGILLCSILYTTIISRGIYLPCNTVYAHSSSSRISLGKFSENEYNIISGSMWRDASAPMRIHTIFSKTTNLLIRINRVCVSLRVCATMRFLRALSARAISDICTCFYHACTHVRTHACTRSLAPAHASVFLCASTFDA